MSRKVRERAENAAFGALLQKHGVKLADSSFQAGLAFYDDLVDHFSPVVMRTARDVLEEVWERMTTHVQTDMEDGAEVDVTDLMREHGLDPNIKSDRYATTKFLVDSGLTQIVSAQPARMIKRIANGARTPAA